VDVNRKTNTQTVERNWSFIKIEHKASKLDVYYTTYTLAGIAKEITSWYVNIINVTSYAKQSNIAYILLLGGILPEKVGGGVQPASQNPYPINQNPRYSLPYLWPDH